MALTHLEASFECYIKTANSTQNIKFRTDCIVLSILTSTLISAIMLT